MTISWSVASLIESIKQEIYYDVKTNKDFVDCVDCFEKIILRLIDQSYCSQLHIRNNNNRRQRLFQDINKQSAM